MPVLLDAPARLEGTVVRDGVRIAYQVFGDGPRAILLLPTWTIVHSDFWRLQVPHFSPRYTVIAFDARGNGASDRPTAPTAYSDEENADDALAVLDAVDIERAAIASVSGGAQWATILAASHPERVAAAVFIASDLPLAPDSSEQVAAAMTFDERRERYVGWGKWNRCYWLEDWPGFLEFFFGRCFTEPDSERFIQHFVEMGLQTTPEVLAATIDAPVMDAETARRIVRAVTCPVLVIHGDADAVSMTAKGVELARLTGAELHVIPGAGHEPELRDAARTNELIDGFLARVWPGGRQSSDSTTQTM